MIHFDGWALLTLAAQEPGLRITLLFFAVGMALSPRVFALISVIVIIANMMVYP